MNSRCDWNWQGRKTRKSFRYEPIRNNITNCRKVQFSNWIALGGPSHYFRWPNCEVVFFMFPRRNYYWPFDVICFYDSAASAIFLEQNLVFGLLAGRNVKKTRRINWPEKNKLHLRSIQYQNAKRVEIKEISSGLFLNVGRIFTSWMFVSFFFLFIHHLSRFLPLICLYSIEPKLLVRGFAQQNTVIN